MLYQPGPISADRDLTVAVHRSLPLDWPDGRSDDGAALHVFQTRDFIEVWQNTRGRGERATCLFVEIKDRRGRRVMLLPLAIAGRWGARALSFIDGGLADFNSPVLYPSAIAWTPELVSSLWSRVLAALPAVDLVTLEKMPVKVDGLFNPLSLLPVRACPENGHGSDLLRPWCEIEAAQLRIKSWRRSLRHLEKLGPVRLMFAETAEERQRVLDRALRQKQRRAEETRVNGFDRDPAKLAYFREATERFAASGTLQLCALMVGEEIVATSWNLVHGRTVSAIMIGYEAGKWAKYSCGRILNLLHMRWLKDNGFAYLDQGFGDEAWKFESCDTHVLLSDHEAPRSMRGHLALRYRDFRVALRANATWQRVRRAIYRPLRHRLDWVGRDGK